MINFTTYRASDADEMARLLGEVFARRDPPAVAVGLTPAEFESFVRLFSPKAAAEGLTIVARSAETGEMIGALLAEDSASASAREVDMSHQQVPGEKTPRQVAVIAVRSSDVLEVCLIRRKDSETWAIPKGFIDPGDSHEQAALKEAVEEAGLRGQIVGNVVGMYDYEKRGAPFTVALYVMKVLKEQKDWREMSFRERRWFTLEEGALLLTGHPVWPLWDRIKERLAAGVV